MKSATFEDALVWVMFQVKSSTGDSTDHLGGAGQKNGGEIESSARKYQNQKLASEYKPQGISPILWELSKDGITPANMWVTFTFVPAN